MFDVGFSELLVISVVALVVIGPEKLPKVARTVGALIGRAQRYVNDVKTDINRQIELDELRNLQSQVRGAAQDVENQVRGLQQDLHAVSSSVAHSTQEAYAASTEPDPYVLDQQRWAREAHERRVRQRVQDRMKNRRKKVQRY